MNKVYYILQNGGYPFKVVINSDGSGESSVISIYKVIPNSDQYESHTSFTYVANKVFIGKSIINEMTEFSGALDHPRWDGNSILLELDADLNKYVFIGETIYSFTALSNIVTFVSPVGNSQVCYPHAIDSEGNCYLMIEHAVILKNVQIDNQENNFFLNPYEYYYKNSKLEGFENIHNLLIGNEHYTLTYSPEPEYNYDSMKNRISNTTFYLVKDDNQEMEVNKDDYIELMQRFGIHNGFRRMENKVIIQDRII